MNGTTKIDQEVATISGNDATLAYRILATEEGVTHTFNRVADSIDNVDDHMDKVTKSSGKLRKEFDQSTNRVKALTDEFDRSGDHALFREIRKEQANVSKMGKLLKVMGSDGSGSMDMMSKSTKGFADNFSKLPIPAVILNPYVAGGLAVSGVIVGIGVAAAATGALLAGMGVGVVGLAGLSVRESDKVKGALSALTDDTVTMFDRAGKGMEEPITAALQSMRRSILSTEPLLDHMFREATPGINSLAVGFDGLLAKMGPGLDHAIDAIGPALVALGDELPAIGAAFGDFFSSLGDAGPGAVEALIFTLRACEAVIVNIGNTLEMASKAFHGLSIVADALTGNIGGVASKMMPLSEGTEGAASSTEGLTGSQKTLADALSDTTTETNSLIQASKLLNNQAIDTAQAEIAAADSVDSLAESLQKSHGSMNRHTEAGRRSEKMLIDGINKAEALANATYDESQSVDKATGAFNNHINALRQTMLRGGMAKSQVDALISAFTRSRGPASTSANAVRGLNAQIAALRSKRAAITETGSAQAKARIAALDRQIRALQNRTVFVTTVQQLEVRDNARFANLKSLGARALGGPVSANTPYVVGEKGPEVMIPNQGGTIVPNNQINTGGGRSAVAGAQHVIVDFNFNGVDEDMIRMFRKAIRVRGGNVQTTLGN